MRRKLIAGNWKMHKTPRQAADFFAQLPPVPAEVEAALLVPFTSLVAAQQVLGEVGYGAQDVSAHLQGAYTGEVSAVMLAELGCRYTVVGHSERRSYHSESDALVARKAARLLEAGICPIVCVGETLEVREAGRPIEYTLAQLEGSLAGLEVRSPDQLVVAYEPVWAIGTGRNASAEDAQQMHLAIRQALAQQYGGVADGIRILYGGSLKPDNAAALLAQPDIDGGLVGGASLEVASLVALLQIAAS